MDLHHSNNPNLYLRQSYISQSGMPRPNLESRIHFREEEKSGKRWCLSILGVILLLFTLYWLFGPVRSSANSTLNRNDRSPTGLVGWIKSRIFGRRSSNDWGFNDGVTSTEGASKSVTTKRQISSDGLDSPDSGSWWSRWWNSGHSNCDKYHMHEAQLARLTPTIKPFAKAPPSLRDIQTFPSRYAQIRQFANDTANQSLSTDVQFLFDEIARERNWATVINNRDITHPDFSAPLADTDFLLQVQLPAKDLTLSSRVLTNKDNTIDRLKDEFHGKNSEKNCTNSLNELRKGHEIYAQKKDYSTGRVDSLTKQLRDVQSNIESSLRRKYSDENGPVAEINRLEQEINTLRSSKARLESRLADSSSGRLPAQRQRVTDLEAKIAANLADIDSIRVRNSRSDADIKAAKDRLDDTLMSLGTFKYRLSIQLRNAEIKDFLSSLLKKEGSEKSLEQLFAETEADKKEIIKIVRAVVQRTKGYETLDINLSEAEWLELIEKDRHEFEEIMKIYHDLKDIIRKYREVDINITALRKDIAAKETSRAAAELEWKSLQARTHLDVDRRGDLERENDKLRLEVKSIESLLTDLKRTAKADQAELDRVLDELSKKETLKNDLDRKHRVN